MSNLSWQVKSSVFYTIDFDEYVALTHCNTLQHTATHCNTLHYKAAHCSTLQHTAAHCNTLQHATTH